MDEVDRQAGSGLAEPCTGDEYRLKLPTGKGSEWRRIHTTRCGMNSLFEVPYDPTQPIKLSLPVFDADGFETDEVVRVLHEGERPEPGYHAVIACALDDNMAAWPRFAAIHGGEETNT